MDTNDKDTGQISPFLCVFVCVHVCVCGRGRGGGVYKNARMTTGLAMSYYTILETFT